MIHVESLNGGDWAECIRKTIQNHAIGGDYFISKFYEVCYIEES